MRYTPLAFVVCAALATLATGCADAEPEQTEQDAISMSGPIARPGSATEVWEVRNAWSDTDPEAGIAWEASSGLTWEQKYQAWVQSLPTIEKTSGYGKTFAVRTPYGDKELPAPTLDCGEVAYMLRVAFSSWYHLPFYVVGWNDGKAMYGGHMGFVTRDGYRFDGFPSFRTRYADYEDSWAPGDEWPRDNSLRKRRLGDDDRNEFLEEEGDPELGIGAYFDEIFLNKRAGHFARLLLLFYGSINLADAANLYHVDADAIAAGDILLKRTNTTGTGHTVPVLNTQRPLENKIAVQVASGNIPRRQPKWEDTLSARHRFTSRYYGGTGENSDGVPYAKMGGGLKRWRAAVLQNGRWRNVALAANQDAYIPESDLERLAARTERFEELLISGSPEEQLATAEKQLELAREHLHKYPASCSKRLAREEALTEIYRIAQEEMGMTVAELDDKYRLLEDYVLAELVYEQSKTCCWNSTTTAMYEIIMSYAEREQAEAEAEGMCVTPTVFRAEGAVSGGSDGYDRWRDYAEEIGRGSEWVTWSEDEFCAQRGVMDDTIAATSATAWCPAE
jgi:hypothetical protein